MNKLNLQRPYGRIIGRCNVCKGAVYTQDGKYFDGHLNEITQKELNHEKANEQRSQKQVNDDGRERQGQGQGHDDVRQEKSNGQEKDDEKELLSSSISESEPVPKLESVSVSELAMILSDDELEALAESGMNDLREYAAKFDVKGRSKSDIINELTALRA